MVNVAYSWNYTVFCRGLFSKALTMNLNATDFIKFQKLFLPKKFTESFLSTLFTYGKQQGYCSD